MAKKRRKPGRPGKNVSDLQGKSVPGEKKSPGRQERLVHELRDNLTKRKAQMHVRRGARGN